MKNATATQMEQAPLNVHPDDVGVDFLKPIRPNMVGTIRRDGEKLGIAILGEPDERGLFPARILTGERARVEIVVDVMEGVRKVSDTAGTAGRIGKDKDESEREALCRLAGIVLPPRRQEEADRDEDPWLGANSHIPGAKWRVTLTPDGRLKLQVRTEGKNVFVPEVAFKSAGDPKPESDKDGLSVLTEWWVCVSRPMNK